MAPQIRAVLVFLSALNLLSCTGHKLYRDIHGPFPELPYKLAYVELDDHGELWQRDQFFGTLLTIAEANEHPDGAIVVIYVHGWKHNASPRNEEKGNLNAFKTQVLQRLVNEQSLSPNPRPVVGVYFAWRGNSLYSPEPAKSIFSYYDRDRAAKRVAGTSSTEALYALMRWTRLNAKSRCVVIGHSMGALIVERALIPAFEAVILDKVIAEAIAMKEAVDEGDDAFPLPTLPASRWDLPADLVLLLNPASSALEAKKFVDLLKFWGVELEVSDDRRFLCSPGSGRWLPLMVSITSKADTPNRVVFPVANYLRGVSQRFRSYEGEEVPREFHSQRFFLSHTGGNAGNLHSHQLRHERSASPLPPGEVAECTPAECALLNDSSTALLGKACFKFLDDIFLMQEKGEGGYNPSPYWILNVPKTVIPGHSDIFNDDIYGLVRGIIAMTDALDPNRRVIMNVEAPSPP